LRPSVNRTVVRRFAEALCNLADNRKIQASVDFVALVIVPATPGSAGVPPASGPEARSPGASVLAGTMTKADFVYKAATPCAWCLLLEIAPRPWQFLKVQLPR
jgi:hypothetical protein